MHACYCIIHALSWGEADKTVGYGVCRLLGTCLHFALRRDHFCTRFNFSATGQPIAHLL